MAAGSISKGVTSFASPSGFSPAFAFWIAASWELSEAGKRAKFYRLTPKGRKQFLAERSKWETFARAMGLVLSPLNQEPL